MIPALNHPLHRLIKAPPLSGNSLENSLHLPELGQNFFGVGIIETRSRNYEHPNEFLVHSNTGKLFQSTLVSVFSVWPQV